MALYEELVTNDHVEVLKELLNQGYHLTEDGVFEFTIDTTMEINTPWVFTQSRIIENVCDIFLGVMFNLISTKLKDPFVPSHCQKCWKVVVRPKTLEQLMAILDIQDESSDVPGKCGIEVRSIVHGLYGAYWYTRSRDAGLNRYRQVRDWLASHPATETLADDKTRVILKRGCTEMEQRCGDSIDWHIKPHQMNYERMVTDYVRRPKPQVLQTEATRIHTMRMWINWAYQSGDPTYRLFTDGPLHKPYRTYHDAE